MTPRPFILLTLVVITACRGASAPSDAFSGTKAGAAHTVAGIALRWCPAGKFLMGSPATEPGRRADEEQVEVVLTHGFWLGQFEITQGQWRRFRPPPREPEAGRGEDYPVYWVSYFDAEDFCGWLTREARSRGELPAGWAFRLPTEAQWEYACRAGTTTAFAFGDRLTTRQANIGRPYRGAPAGFPAGAATAVGSYPPNAWGLHDMHGNEFEWCRDWYHARLPGGTDPDLAERKGEPNRDGSHSRVRRGGAWMDAAEFCRSALRLRYEPERSSDHIGFRVALVRMSRE
ncbi:MAG: formylglycine-generating enzyme family protein [Opitutaceae bacterium]|nr:formylglycine-generating enzyme family protein [Opitutaceae bacterium]